MIAHANIGFVFLTAQRIRTDEYVYDLQCTQVLPLPPPTFLPTHGRASLVRWPSCRVIAVDDFLTHSSGKRSLTDPPPTPRHVTCRVSVYYMTYTRESHLVRTPHAITGVIVAVCVFIDMSPIKNALQICLPCFSADTCSFGWANTRSHTFQCKLHVCRFFFGHVDSFCLELLQIQVKGYPKTSSSLITTENCKV